MSVIGIYRQQPLLSNRQSPFRGCFLQIDMATINEHNLSQVLGIPPFLFCPEPNIDIVTPSNSQRF
jgi:hypothetical protein